MSYKLHYYTCNIILTRTRNVIDDVQVNKRFLIEIMFILKAIKGHMINRILHEWSFYVKFIKLAEDSFHKFHMK